MEGGMKRQRGYLWLTLLLMATTVIVVLLPRQQSPIPQELPTVQEEKATDYGEQHYRYRQRHWGYGYSPATHTRQTEAAQQPFGQPVQRRAALVVELNSADSLDLVQLYNIGPVFARRILRYRERLGGFCSVEQLKEVYGMDSVRYGSLLPYVRIDTTQIHRIDINSASLDQLKRHPYLDYYQAKAIVQLRDKVGPFQEVEDLRNIPTIEIATYNKIAPYLLCSLPQVR